MKKLPLKENLWKYTHIESCPIRNVVARFSNKWSILVLCVLSENEFTRFNAIQKTIPDISSKVLTDTLKNLGGDNLVIRTLHPEIPPRVEYSLSEMGKSLIPLIGALIGWAVENYESFNSQKEQGNERNR